MVAERNRVRNKFDCLICTYQSRNVQQTNKRKPKITTTTKYGPVNMLRKLIECWIETLLCCNSRFANGNCAVCQNCTQSFAKLHLM